MNEFNDHLEYGRQFLMDKAYNTMPVTKKSQEETNLPPAQASPPKRKSELESLRDQMKALTEEMERLGNRPKSTTYCAYCKSNSNALRDFKITTSRVML